VSAGRGIAAARRYRGRPRLGDSPARATRVAGRRGFARSRPHSVALPRN